MIFKEFASSFYSSSNLCFSFLYFKIFKSILLIFSLNSSLLSFVVTYLSMVIYSCQISSVSSMISWKRSKISDRCTLSSCVCFDWWGFDFTFTYDFCSCFGESKVNSRWSFIFCSNCSFYSCKSTADPFHPSLCFFS